MQGNVGDELVDYPWRVSETFSYFLPACLPVWNAGDVPKTHKGDPVVPHDGVIGVLGLAPGAGPKLELFDTLCCWNVAS